MEPTLKQVDLVVPVFNEEEAIVSFHSQLSAAVAALPYRFRIYYVNDGSQDQTARLLDQIAGEDERVTVIELSRNFGHQAALTAGLDQVQGDYVITLDGDGQHPPELIGEMLRLAVVGSASHRASHCASQSPRSSEGPYFGERPRASEGPNFGDPAEDKYDIVLMQRMEEDGLTPFKRSTSHFFYGLINRIGETKVVPGAADFRLLTRPVVLALRSMREYHRFLRGMVNWMGFRTVILPYSQPQRLAGASKYTFKKMFSLAENAVFSFSLVPLYIAMSIGGLFLILAIIEAIYVLSFWVTGRQSGLAPGWSSLMFMLLIVGGSVLVALGLIGVYIGYIFQEVKRRPVYLIRRTWSKAEGSASQSPRSSEGPDFGDPGEGERQPEPLQPV